MTCWENFTSIFSYKGNTHTSLRRFPVLLVFCLYSMSNALQWLTYSPIPTSSKAYYNMSTSQLNMFSTIYMIVYIVLALFSSLGVERIGLRPCMVIGTFLNALGAFLKLVCGFPSGDYGLIMAAQVINAFSQLFVLSVPPTIASIWFRDSERYTATALGTVANAVGCAVGMLIPPLWVKEEDEDPSDGFLKLYAFQFALCGGAFLGAIFLVPSATAPTPEEVAALNAAEEAKKNGTAAIEDRKDSQMQVIDERPAAVAAADVPAPGTVAAEESGEVVPVAAADPNSLKEIALSVLELVKDWNCMIAVLALSISVGSVWATNSLLAQLLGTINISEEDAGQMGFWNIIAGTIVAIFAGPIVDRFRVYKWPIVGLAVVNLVCLSLIIMMMYIDDTNQGDAVNSGSLAGIYFLNVFTGIPQNVLTPVGFEFLMELSFGHSGSVTGALLMAGANLVSLIEVSIGSALIGDDDVIPKENALNAFWLVWAILVFGLCLLMVPRNNLKRLAAEQKAKALEAQKASATAAVAVEGGGANNALAAPSAAADVPRPGAAVVASPQQQLPPIPDDVDAKLRAADDEANEEEGAAKEETHPNVIVAEDNSAFDAAAPAPIAATQKEEATQ